MAVIVTYKPNGQKYLLVGCGFGARNKVQQGFMGFNNNPDEPYPMAVLVDAAGGLHWVRTHDVEVTLVDGARPQDLLRQERPQDLPIIDPSD